MNTKFKTGLIFLLNLITSFGSYAEMVPAGTQFKDQSLDGKVFTPSAIIERLKIIDQSCTSRRLDDDSQDYRFIGSLNAQAPLPELVIRQLVSMVDILDTKQSLIHGLTSSRSSTWASLAANVLIRSESAAYDIVKDETSKYIGKPQHPILLGVTSQIDKLVQSREATIKRRSMKRSEESPPSLKQAESQTAASAVIGTQQRLIWPWVCGGAGIVLLFAMMRFWLNKRDR